MQRLAATLPVKILAVLLPAALYAGDAPWESPMHPGALFFMLAPEYQTDVPLDGVQRLEIEHIDQFLDQIHAVKVERTFPYCLPPTPNGADLTRFYTLYFPESLPILTICDDMAKLEGVEWAEPWYFHKVLLDHNDPNRNRQYGLDLCEANNAHDISTGSPDAVAAIVDTGVDHDHEDLLANRWVNPGEDLNGNGVIENNERNNRDDDNNGRVDDFYGWDFVNRDNDPTDVDGHGTHTAGITSAVTNNNRGVASVGYSCSIMAVRTGTGGVIQYGYQGIEYAVRNNADVISCSWGGYQGGNAGRNVINYAFNNGSLVIAAAGNDNVRNMLYPAGYENCVAVAATDNRDRKANFSNYGNWVDISAPGVQIYSTYPANRYAYMSGTSMACPFASSVAILIKATYPHLDVDEVRQLLIDGADDIYDINGAYQGELGSGRINAFLSLLLAARPILAIDSMDITLDDNDNGQFDPGESVELTITVSNSDNGEPAEEIWVVLGTQDPDLTIPQAIIDFPALEGGESFTNDENPFVIDIDENALPHTTWITFTLYAQPGDIEITREFEIVVGHPDILIVDDDGGGDFERWYFSSLAQLNMGWRRWDVVANLELPPDPATISGHEMVIWLTGNSNPPLDELDRFMMSAALDDRANILLIGKWIGDDEENHDFLREYFGARHELDSVNAVTVEGLPNDRPLAEDVQMLLTGNNAAGNGRISPSAMSLVHNSDSLVVYKRGNSVTGLAGIYLQNQRTWSKSVYLGFAFESVGDAIATPRHVVISQLFDWFSGNVSAPGEEPFTPSAYWLEAAYPNPFNGRALLRFNVPLGAAYTLDVFDVSGRQIDVIAASNGSGRPISAVWNADAAPSGVYLARLTSLGGAPIERTLMLMK